MGVAICINKIGGRNSLSPFRLTQFRPPPPIRTKSASEYVFHPSLMIFVRGCQDWIALTLFQYATAIPPRFYNLPTCITFTSRTWLQRHLSDDDDKNDEIFPIFHTDVCDGAFSTREVCRWERERERESCFVRHHATGNLIIEGREPCLIKTQSYNSDSVGRARATCTCTDASTPTWV